MGLDMRPMGRPKPGFEKRFAEIFDLLQNGVEPKLSFWDKLKGMKEKKKQIVEEALLKEWFEIQTASYETIQAPQVGKDKDADNWIIQQVKDSNGEQSDETILKEYDGFYVIALAKEMDGVPVYISAAQDENVFRGQFLKSCKTLIGKALVNEAWDSKLAPGALDYGQRLMHAADKVAETHNLQYLKTQREPPDVNEDAVEFKLHVVFSLAKWLIFYGKNGHGYEADS